MATDRKAKCLAPIEQLAPELLATIANDLEDGDVYNVTMASTILLSKLDRYLYARDAMRPAPKGLKHAVFCGNDLLGVAIIQKYPESFAKKCVNTIFRDDNTLYTALHIAAGFGHVNMIKKLHQLGAISSRFGLKLRKVLGSRFQTHLSVHEYLRPYMSQTMWMPNFAPLVKRDFKTFEILDELYPGPCVGVAATKGLPADLESDDEEPVWVLNLHHFAPLINSYKLLEIALLKYQADDEAPGGPNKQSVFHFAVKARCSDCIRQLLDVTVGFGDGLLDREGYSPLHHAIRDGILDDLERRDEWRPMLKTLLDDFNPTAQQMGGKWQTPLLIAAEFIPLDWSTRHAGIKFALRTLIDRERAIQHAYDLGHLPTMINYPDNHGKTVLSIIAKEIIARKGNTSLENLFKEMVRCGADINLDVNTIVNPHRYVHSIRHLADNASKTGLKGFLKILHAEGAALHAAEQSGTLTINVAAGQQPYVQAAPFDGTLLYDVPTCAEVASRENTRIVECFRAAMAANPAMYDDAALTNGPAINAPGVANAPNVPNVPNVPHVPHVPHVPNIPQHLVVPAISNAPNAPGAPTSVEVARQEKARFLEHFRAILAAHPAGHDPIALARDIFKNPRNDPYLPPHLRGQFYSRLALMVSVGARLQGFNPQAGSPQAGTFQAGHSQVDLSQPSSSSAAIGTTDEAAPGGQPNQP
ncbi:hypothetical protein NW762_002331 [Fusarium torreyae]|uniref:Ankyrin n=1 Tax=Fusarium torreyae TaxID=1237075 RepID=A0A9W8SBZ2_9HYPO|nr:hypothetical protein NW762_002331 [Fusarium torreyae]